MVIPKKKDGLTGISKVCRSSCFTGKPFCLYLDLTLTPVVQMETKHEALVGHLFYVASKVAADEGLAKDGYRLVINEGKNGCQSVFTLHIHLIGGKKLSWPPGC